MAIQFVQRIIYRNMVQRPTVSTVLDRIGTGFQKIGIPYASGLTRQKAAYLVSNDVSEIQRAMEHLNSTGRARAHRVVRDSSFGLVVGQYGVPMAHVDAVAEVFGLRPGLDYLAQSLPADGSVEASQSLFDAVENLKGAALTAAEITDVLNSVTRFGLESTVRWNLLPRISTLAHAFQEDGAHHHQISLFLPRLASDPGIGVGHAFDIMDTLRSQGFRVRQIARMFDRIEATGEHYKTSRMRQVEVVANRLRALGLTPDHIRDFVDSPAVGHTIRLDRAMDIAERLIRAGRTLQGVLSFLHLIDANTSAALQLHPARVTLQLLDAGYTDTEIIAIIRCLNTMAMNIANYSAQVLVESMITLKIPREEVLAFAHAVNRIEVESPLLRAIYLAAHDIIRTRGSTRVITGLLEIGAEDGWNTHLSRQRMIHHLREQLGVSAIFIGFVKNLGLHEEIAYLLNDPETPPAEIGAILAIAHGIVRKNWSHILSGRPPEELSRVFEFCARVMAEKAHSTYERIKAIAEQTRKPTVTVYILSTAYKLNIERLADQFLERGLTRGETATLLASYRREVHAKIKDGTPYLEARLEVARDWLKDGRMSRYTHPVYLKVPSARKPSSAVDERLQQLRDLSERKNVDFVFVDHSTVRVKTLKTLGDPHDFEKGRALARALRIVDPRCKRRHWLYKVNGWKIPELSLDRPNMVALNLYDGKVYESHTGGPKDWLPVDDNGEFVGVSWDAEGNEKRTDYLVVAQDNSQRYRVYLASQLFQLEFRAALAELQTRPPKWRIPTRDILFVCDWNHHRSPLAQFLMRYLLDQRVEGAGEIKVDSAALTLDTFMATRGQKVSDPYLPSARIADLVQQRSANFGSFRKKQVDNQMVAQADVIFVFEERQRDEILTRFPEAVGKVHLLREYAGYAKADWNLPTPKSFNYQTRYIFEEALARALRRLAGEDLQAVHPVPGQPFRGWADYKYAA